MDYTPFQYLDAFSIISPIMVIATTLVLVLALYFSWSVESEEEKKKNNVLFAVGILLALATVSLMVYGAVTGSAPDTRKDAYFRDAATGLSETYGIKVTEQNIKEMGYPTEEQNERRYFGITAVKTGPAVNDFITARLAYDDGKVYLLKQVGEDYEELKPVR